MTPALPPGFKLDPVPDLPPGFKLDPVETTSTEALKGPQRTTKLKLKPRADVDAPMRELQEQGGAESLPFFSRATAGMKGLREGKAADFLGNLIGAGAELVRPEAETVATIETGKGVYGAGKALLSGSAKPALGLAAGIGTGYVVDKATRALGLPGWLPEILGGLAGAKVGGAVGMSPEAVEAFQSGGVKGLLKKLLFGGTTENEAFEFYKQTHGQAPKTGAEKLAARAEAAAYKKKIAKQLAKAEKPSKAPLKPKAEVKADEVIAKTTAPTKEPLNARVGKQAPKQAPPGDLRRQLFVNVSDALKKNGRLLNTGRREAFRELVATQYGKRISEMNDAELDSVIRNLPTLVQQLK